MGNRAVIATSTDKTAPAIYLHWNGGPESVLAFLHAAKALGVRSPGDDPSYFNARMCQIIGNFFGGSLSLGLGPRNQLDDSNSDNGTYIVGGDFEIVGRTYPGPKHVDHLSPAEHEKYVGIRDSIIENQRAAFYDGDWNTDIVITRVARGEKGD